MAQRRERIEKARISGNDVRENAVRETLDTVLQRQFLFLQPGQFQLIHIASLSQSLNLDIEPTMFDFQACMQFGRIVVIHLATS